jgi:hypothetical protein
MDATTQKIDKKNIASYSKTTNDIDVLSGKKILAFPTSLGSTIKDEAGNDFAYVIIRINTSDTGSKLREDASSGDVLIAAGAVQTGSAQDLGKLDKITNKFNPLTSNKYLEGRQADQDLSTRYGKAAVSKENSKGWTKKFGLTKLDKVIVLPMPADYSVDTAINYEPTESGDLSKILDAAASIESGGISAYLKMAATSIAASIGAGAINAAKDVMGMKPGSTEDMTRKLYAMSREAENPKKEILFKDIGFRNFTFAYVLSPKNALESATIQEIIRTLRYYALPELQKGKLFYTFPGEFEIAMMKGGIENTALPRIATCVLEDVGVTFTSGGGTWGNLPDGMTPMVNLTLQFKEIEIIDRNRVWNRDSVITSGY